MVTIEGRVLRCERWGILIEVEKSASDYTKLAVLYGDHALRVKRGETVAIECYVYWKLDAAENWNLKFIAVSGHKLVEDEDDARWEEIERIKIDRENRNGKPQNGKPTNKPASPARRKGQYLAPYDEEPEF